MFGTHNLQTFEHNTLINELLLNAYAVLFNIRVADARLRDTHTIYSPSGFLITIVFG